MFGFRRAKKVTPKGLYKKKRRAIKRGKRFITPVRPRPATTIYSPIHVE